MTRAKFFLSAVLNLLPCFVSAQTDSDGKDLSETIQAEIRDLADEAAAQD